jgi:hypothetical protein
MSTSYGSQRWSLVAVAILLALGAVAIVILGFSYESLRRQLAGISSDLARLQTPDISREHGEVRAFVIRSKLSRVIDPVVVMGDSIVEAADLPASICGHPVINAGVGGATIGYFVRNAPLLLEDTRPSLVVLAVGVNDAMRGGDAGLFQAAYEAVIHSFGDVPLLVATIAATGPGAVLFDQSLVEKFNGVIRHLTDRPVEMDQIRGFTVADGVHLNSAGYKLWNSKIVTAVGENLGCGTEKSPTTARLAPKAPRG